MNQKFMSSFFSAYTANTYLIKYCFVFPQNMESESNGVTVQNGSIKSEGIKQYYVGKIEELQVSVF